MRGFTLFEMLLALGVAGVIAAIATPRFTQLRDRLAVHGAASSLVRALADGREAATRLGERHAVVVDTLSATVRVYSVRDTILVTPLGQLFGVRLSASRDSIAYAGTGLGYGAANTRYILSRGAAVDSITVSRAGRVLR
jgi:prepilin-type N-terminal cleavage/methylation domain-containing protein